MKPIVIVLGANGFLGTNLLRRFNEGGYRCVGLSRATKPKSSIHQTIVVDPFTSKTVVNVVKSIAGPKILIILLGRCRESTGSEILLTNYFLNYDICCALRGDQNIRVIHISGFGIPAGKILSSESYYFSKGRFTQFLKSESDLRSKIFSPSYILGRNDEFRQQIVRAKQSGQMAFPGSGKYHIQPLHVKDFCEVVFSFVKHRRRFDGREIPVLGQQISYRAFVESIARIVAPNVVVHSVDLEEAIRDALFSSAPNWSVAELSILISGKIGIYREKIYGAEIRNWTKLLSSLIYEYGNEQRNLE